MHPASSAAPRPLVSVVITCYNYAHYLTEAIESVRQQTYPVKEIIVVDDGSTDNTREVVNRYPEVVYIYQQNRGLSAARNTGIKESKGEYLVFLDADDWLLPDALALNVPYLQQHPQAAFVAGSHSRVYANGQGSEEKQLVISPNPYYRLLSLGNYIAMISAVMFARWALEKHSFDVSLRNCEDFDLYLNLTRYYPILQHQHPLAAYRIHTSSMSADTSQMLSGALKVLNRQRQNLRTPLEIEAYTRGVDCWNQYYSGENNFKLTAEQLPGYLQTMDFFRKYNHELGLRYFLNNLPIISRVKRQLLASGESRAGEGSTGLQQRPVAGKVDPAAFNRAIPFNPEFGYDPCWPIDYYYTKKFLDREAPSIKGRVVTITVTATPIPGLTGADYHKHSGNTPHEAPLAVDLKAIADLPANTFDCVIFAQSLHLVYDFRALVQECNRVLKPGGTLLLIAPGNGEWKETWHWSFTSKGLRCLLKSEFSARKLKIRSFGNADVAAAYLYGMELPALAPKKLQRFDPEYQVMHTVKAVKA